MTTTINPYLRLLYYYDIDSKGILYEKKRRKENICANSTNNKYIELWLWQSKCISSLLSCNKRYNNLCVLRENETEYKHFSVEMIAKLLSYCVYSIP